MKKPLLSVVMVVYNGEKYLKQAIESVLNQPFKNFELIIVDDGSTDNTSLILSYYKKKDKRIIVIKNKKNKGSFYSRNRAINLSKGCYVAIMDSDDIALPNRFIEQIKFLKQNRHVSAVGSWAKVINSEGAIIGDLKPPTNYEVIKRQIIRTNCLVHSTLMAKKEVFIEFPYDENLPFAADYDFLIRMVRKYVFVNLPKILIKYRMHNENISTRFRKKQLKCALKVRYSAIKKGYYPLWTLIFLSKPFLEYLLPLKFVRFQKQFFNLFRSL